MKNPISISTISHMPHLTGHTHCMSVKIKYISKVDVQNFHPLDNYSLWTGHSKFQAQVFQVISSKVCVFVCLIELKLH